MTEQFHKSLKLLQEKKGYGDGLTDSLDELLKGYYIEETDEDALINFFFKGYLIQSFEKVFNVIIEETFSYCESPIEKMMFVALTLAGRERFDEVVLKRESLEFRELREGIDRLIIEPQHKVGNYRVDFLVTLVSKYPVDKPDGDGYEVHEMRHEIIVECDGHEFHERTKEQAKKDKKRDRALLDLGFRVYRFTGSEVWNDPFDCAWQVIENLRQRDLESHKEGF